MIKLHSIRVCRYGLNVLDDFSWEIRRGEHWLIHGKNGIGKTTLLELLAGKIHHVAGELDIEFIQGATWDERYASRKRLIHYMPTHAAQSLIGQDQEQYYQQRYYDIGNSRVPAVTAVLGGTGVLELLDLPKTFSISSLLDVEINRLSNGQLKKILLIKVLLTGIPKLFLLDYPFEGLDKDSRQDLCSFIDYLSERYAVQFIIVDHNHQLPGVINWTLTLDDMGVAQKKPFVADSQVIHHSEKSTGNGSVQTVVEVKDLRIQYGKHTILENFNWIVKKGERWALVGRNGAGKTTLFSMIFADHPMAYSQQVYLFGKRRGSGESIWDIKRRINYLGPEQMSYLSPNHLSFTASSYLQPLARKGNEQRLKELISVFEAEYIMNKVIRTLSSGQLQVMLIIQCLLKDAELLLLDEPFQFLDPVKKSQLKHFLRSHVRQDQTLILITHDENDLIEWTDHVKKI